MLASAKKWHRLTFWVGKGSMDDAGWCLDLQAQLCKPWLLGPLQPVVAHAHLVVGMSTHPFASLSFSSAVGPRADFQLLFFFFCGLVLVSWIRDQSLLDAQKSRGISYQRNLQTWDSSASALNKNTYVQAIRAAVFRRRGKPHFADMNNKGPSGN